MNIEETLQTLCPSTNENNPIKKAFDAKSRYFDDLVDELNVLSSSLNDKQLDKYLKEKLQLGSPVFEEDKYYQSATELTVIFCINKMPHDKFYYETPVVAGSKKNPECTITSGAYSINVEAKSPSRNVEQQEQQPEGKTVLKVVSAGRAPTSNGLLNLIEQINAGFATQNFSVEPTKRNDNKLKDYLKSAHSKFDDAGSGDSLNVLFLALDDVDEVAAYFDYLYGNQGLFREDSYEPLKNYNRVDSIVLSNSLFRHRHHEKINGSAWNLSEAFCLLFSNKFRQAEKKEANQLFINNFPNFTKGFNSYEIEFHDSDFEFEIKRALKVQGYIREKLEREDGKYLFLRKELMPTYDDSNT